MSLFEIFQTYLFMSNALNASLIVVSKTCSFPLSAVSLYEVVAEIDDEGKETSNLVPQITLSSGKEIVLLPEQNAEFQPQWNKKVDIDDKLRGYVEALDLYFVEQAAQLATA